MYAQNREPRFHSTPKLPLFLAFPVEFQRELERGSQPSDRGVPSHIFFSRARDVGVVPFIIAAFDAAAVFVATANYVASAVPTSGETNGIIENSNDEEVDKEDHDVSRTVLTSELQELPPLILSEYFSAKVTVRSRVTILKDIHKWLTKQDKTVFRRYPQLGGGSSKDEIKAQEEKNELKNKYWPRKKSVLLKDVVKKLK
ncbi:hypothetical protein TIFTF001_017698 [Ficus carica]|uniref:Uncharacterized protein n=1 Tax=Ficus carica TaxID=3494 RepID=A0AA88DB06_FICCA|nr:hypothetical protein TIFTF001_017698 [Ficus carica]